MEHNYAIQNHTAERYLLEELPQDEREAYEEHFFSCSVCAEEVQAASQFIDGARELIQNQVKAELYGHAKQPSIWGSWLNWRSIMQPLPAMACMLLVFVSGFSAYQNGVTIPELRTSLAAQSQGTEIAQVITSPVRLSESRAGGENLVSVTKGKPICLQFDIPPQKFSSYEAWIETESGVRNRKLSLSPISAEDAKNPVQIAIRAGALQPGNYIVVIQGVNSTGTESGIKGEPVRFSFQLTIQD